MPVITVLPHDPLCPEGLQLDASEGDNLLDVLCNKAVPMEHACEKSGVCTTCHVYIRQGGESVNDPEDIEDDNIDRAWGVEPDSRLSCMVFVGAEDLVIEIPKYTRNQVSENH